MMFTLLLGYHNGNFPSGSCEKIDFFHFAAILGGDQKCLASCSKSFIGHLNAKFFGDQISPNLGNQFFSQLPVPPVSPCFIPGFISQHKHPLNTTKGAAPGTLRKRRRVRHPHWGVPKQKSKETK